MGEASSICRSSRRISLPRRELLRSAGQTSLAASMAAAGLTWPGHAEAFAQDTTPEAGDCPSILVFAKKSFEPRGGANCEKLCQCRDAVDFRLIQDNVVLIAPTDCDETAEVIPEGTVLDFGGVTRTLRVPGPAGTWVGSHEGRFSLRLPGGSGSIDGQVWGISGLDTCQGSCESPTHDEGMLVGEGRGELEGCSLRASYRGEVQFGDSNDPCSIDWTTLELNLRGILSCRCQG